MGKFSGWVRRELGGTREDLKPTYNKEGLTVWDMRAERPWETSMVVLWSWLPPCVVCCEAALWPSAF